MLFPFLAQPSGKPAASLSRICANWTLYPWQPVPLIAYARCGAIVERIPGQPWNLARRWSKHVEAQRMDELLQAILLHEHKVAQTT
jgi:hypothetical protein